MTKTTAPTGGAEIDVEALLASVDLAEVAGRYVELRKVGAEWLGLCPFHGERTPSFRVVPAKQFFHCFGCGAHGDAIDLVRELDGVSFVEACERLGAAAPARPRQPARPPEPERVTSKPPAGAGVPDMRSREFGEPVKVWAYRDAAGDVLGYVARYEYEQDGRRHKLTPQWTWGQRGTGRPGWSMGHWSRPRPLYGLDRLAQRPDAPVLICEGEKATDAGALLLQAYVAASWPGGVNAIKHADWRPLAGRSVVIWPDADEPGRAAAQEIAAILHGQGCRVRVVDVSDRGDGWDLADALAEGWNSGKVLAYARQHIGKDWAPAEAAPEPEPLEPPARPEPPIDAYEPDAPATSAATSAGGNVVRLRYNRHEEVTALGAEPWEEPVDLFLELAVPKLQREWLPPVLSDYVFDQAEIVGTDPEIMALSCLVACAGAADDRIKVQPAHHNHGWHESPRLWGAIVGDPSIKKSPAVSRAVSRLRKLDIDLAKDESAALAKHALAMKVYDKQEKAYIEAAAKDEDTKAPTKPEQPEIQRLLVEDVTVEALSEILKLNPRGVLCLADELSGWFGAMDAYKGGGSGSKDRAHWLEIYNGGPRRIDRVARGKILVPNWSACMLGGIQPDTIRRVFKDTPADGLLQRFMVVIGTTGKPGVDRAPDIEAQNAYRALIEQIFNTKAGPDAIQLSAQAKLLHDEIVSFAYEMIGLRVLPVALCSHLGKWEGLAPRLMVTFHIIECAAAYRHPSGEISGETAQRVRDFMVRFLFRHALAFYADVLGDSGYTEAVRWIGGYILARGEPALKNRDLLRDYGWWKQAKEWERSTVMQRLVDFGWLRPENQERDRFKALPTSLVVNPAVFATFEGIGKEERRRRAAVKAVLRGEGESA